MNIFDALNEVIQSLAEAHAHIASLQWSKDNSVVHGTVCDVDTKKQRCRIVIGKDEDDKDVKSPWIPYSQIAGTRKVHSAPSKGQQMTVMAPNGDYSQSMAFPFTWSDNNPSPSEKGDEDIDLRGKTKRTQKDGSVKQEVDGVTREYTKQSHSLTVHKDPETQQEGKGEEVSDKKPWKGNRAKALHVKKLTKDGGFELTVNVEGKEHKIKVHPENGIEHSFDKGKHKIIINKDEIKHSFDNGQHEVSLSQDGIKHKSSQRVTIDAPQIQHVGDMMLSGSLSVAKVIQSAIGLKAPIIGAAPGDPGNANTW